MPSHLLLCPGHPALPSFVFDYLFGFDLVGQKLLLMQRSSQEIILQVLQICCVSSQSVQCVPQAPSSPSLITAPISAGSALRGSATHPRRTSSLAGAACWSLFYWQHKRGHSEPRAGKLVGVSIYPACSSTTIECHGQEAQHLVEMLPFLILCGTYLPPLHNQMSSL